MNHESMLRMGDDELEAYARALGTTTRACADREGKVALIERKRGRSVELEALGVPLTVPLKRAHDKRFTDLVNRPGRTDKDLTEGFRILLGDEQYGELEDAATDEDGTVDVTALGLAFSRILGSEELKNW